MPFKIIRDDITRVKADVIVNTANPMPVYGRGTDEAIYSAAGREELLEVRKKIGEMSPGEAAVSEAFALPAKYIIHTCGPEWIDGEHQEKDILRSCYRKSLYLARQLGCQSIAFPLISTGSYGFPRSLGLEIALDEIRTFLKKEEMDVILVVYDKQSFALSKSLTDRVESYIDDLYVQEHMPVYAAGGFTNKRKKSSLPGNLYRPEEEPADFSAPIPGEESLQRRLKDVVEQTQETFQEKLLRMIDERGLTDVEVYKRANIDRKLFSKIRCNPEYHPRKETVLALAAALHLNLDETRDLLQRAGKALSPADKADVIVQFCIENEVYDIYEINALLFMYDQPLLCE
ncbi:MAG: macro domain-containing protein [Solobacterium sp.]|nr:macro domain-containing protein [Solobacterium sp.]